MSAISLDRVRQAVDALAWPGAVGIALVAFAAMFHFSAVRPLERELGELRSLEADLEARANAGAGVAPELTAAEQLAAFHAFFPPASAVPELLGRIHAAAKKHRLALNVGEYRLERAEGARLARYQVTLPVEGTYPQVRAFIGDVLVAVPSASLDEIVLKRDTVESGRLEARVRLTLFLGGGK